MTHGVIDQQLRPLLLGPVRRDQRVDRRHHGRDRRPPAPRRRATRRPAGRSAEDLPGRRDSATCRTRPLFNDPDRMTSALCGGRHVSVPRQRRCALQQRRRQQDRLPDLAGRARSTARPSPASTPPTPRLTKTARALPRRASRPLTSGSDYADLADVLDQSCQDLRGRGHRRLHGRRLHQRARRDRGHRAAAPRPRNAPQPPTPPTTCPAGTVKRVAVRQRDRRPGDEVHRRVDLAGAGLRGRLLGQQRHLRRATRGTREDPTSTATTSALVAAVRRRRAAGRAAELPVVPALAAARLPRAATLLTTAAPSRSTTSATPCRPLDTAALPWVNGPTQTLAPAAQRRTRRAFGGDSLGWVASRLDLSSFAGPDGQAAVHACPPTPASPHSAGGSTTSRSTRVTSPSRRRSGRTPKRPDAAIHAASASAATLKVQAV